MKELEIRIALQGPEHLDVANTFANIGRCLAQRDENGTALQHFLKALQIMKIHHGESSVEVASASVEVGIAYKKCHKYREAREYFDNAQDIFGEARSVKYRHRLAEVSMSIAEVLNVQGLHAEALSRYDAARDALRDMGGDPIEVARAEHGMAQALMGSGRYQEAEALLCSVFATRLKRGHKTVSVAETLSTIAEVLVGLGRPEEALQKAKMALGMREELLGPQHGEVGNSHYVLAKCHEALRDFGSAMNECQRAAPILINAYSADSPIVQDNLALVRRAAAGAAAVQSGRQPGKG
mmetsp:Transcript_56704/g.151264  ORF Transcript_56704/g.151264 Transcript_56704/m.151264 type:complete len:296 (+) Transcript_56704:1221-2108(+)